MIWKPTANFPYLEQRPIEHREQGASTPWNEHQPLYFRIITYRELNEGKERKRAIFKVGFRSDKGDNSWQILHVEAKWENLSFMDSNLSQHIQLEEKTVCFKLSKAPLIFRRDFKKVKCWQVCNHDFFFNADVMTSLLSKKFNSKCKNFTTSVQKIQDNQTASRIISHQNMTTKSPNSNRQ